MVVVGQTPQVVQETVSIEVKQPETLTVSSRIHSPTRVQHVVSNVPKVNDDQLVVNSIPLQQQSQLLLQPYN